MAVTTLQQAPRRGINVYENVDQARDIAEFLALAAPFTELSDAGKDGLSDILTHVRELLDAALAKMSPAQ